MEIKPGAHVAVVGCVSSGKSTLLNTLLGGVLCSKGHVSLHGSIAYCPQVWNWFWYVLLPLMYLYV